MGDGGIMRRFLGHWWHALNGVSWIVSHFLNVEWVVLLNYTSSTICQCRPKACGQTNHQSNFQSVSQNEYFHLLNLLSHILVKVTENWVTQEPISIPQDSLTELCIPSAKNGHELLTLLGNIQTLNTQGDSSSWDRKEFQRNSQSHCWL